MSAPRRSRFAPWIAAVLAAALLAPATAIAHQPEAPGEPAPHRPGPAPAQRWSADLLSAALPWYLKGIVPWALAALNLEPTVLAPHENVEYVGGDNGFTGGHISVEGDRLYVGAYGLGMRIFDVSDPARPAFIGEYVPGDRADAVPDAAVFDGRHIAILNGTRRVSSPFPDDVRTDRSEFLDVTDPADPKLLWTFLGQDDGEAHNGDIDDGRRLWFPSGGSGAVASPSPNFTHRGLRIYDLSPVLETPARAPERIIGVDPAKLWEASPYRRGRPVGPAFSHTHDITLYPDYPVRQPDGTLALRHIALLAEGDGYVDTTTFGGSVFVIDVTDPRDPVVLLRWLHDHTAPGHHPIRYHHEAQFLDGDPRLMLVTDEDLHNGCGGAGGVVAVRLSDDLTEATELSEWFIPLGTPAAVCSVHVMSSWREFLFLGSYSAGLQVVDYSDPANPTQAGHYIAEGSTAWGALYHRGYVYVGDMSRGLDVFRFTPPLPDPTLSSDDIEFSSEKVVGGDRVTITATIRNDGSAAARDVAVRFTDNGRQIGSDQMISSIPAGEAGRASVTWETKGLKGDRTITVTADPRDTITETDEANNSASRTVTVRGNKVRNGSFEESSSGTTPDGWSPSGPTSWETAGSDGSRSASTGPGGAWVSDPIAVAPGATYGVSVAASGATGSLVVEQLGPSGAVLGTLTSVLALATEGTFRVVSDTVAVADGVTELRIRLAGGLAGVTTFDDVRLWEE